MPSAPITDCPFNSTYGTDHSNCPYCRMDFVEQHTALISGEPGYDPDVSEERDHRINEQLDSERRARRQSPQRGEQAVAEQSQAYHATLNHFQQPSSSPGRNVFQQLREETRREREQRDLEQLRQELRAAQEQTAVPSPVYTIPYNPSFSPAESLEQVQNLYQQGGVTQEQSRELLGYPEFTLQNVVESANTIASRGMVSDRHQPQYPTRDLQTVRIPVVERPRTGWAVNGDRLDNNYTERIRVMEIREIVGDPDYEYEVWYNGNRLFRTSQNDVRWDRLQPEDYVALHELVHRVFRNH